MSPEQYREKWDLPPDYPMVAPSYATKRSDLAKKLGLGRRAVEAKTVEQEKPLEQMPAKPWQVVSAPEKVAPPPAAERRPEPAAERRPEPTLDSVFRSFPKAEAEEAEAEAGDAQGQRRSARKPFSKQLARSMRP
jgi:hypothetical protein